MIISETTAMAAFPDHIDAIIGAFNAIVRKPVVHWIPPYGTMPDILCIYHPNASRPDLSIEGSNISNKFSF